MKQNKLILIFISIFVISLITPASILYLLEDYNIKNMHELSSIAFDNNYTVNESPIVRTVYSKYKNEKYRVTTGDRMLYAEPYTTIDGETLENDVLIKLKELEGIEMLQEVFFKDIKANKDMIERTNDFRSEKITYSKTRIFLPNDNYKNAFMSFEVENITGKIIALKAPKQYVNTTKDILESYIDYLGLKSNEWVYEENSVKSSNLKIEIKIEDINNIVSVNIVPYND